MQVIVSPAIGFCYGVKLALEGALSHSRPGRIFTLGPLIHNPRVVEELKEKGIGAVQSLGELQSGDTIVISAQGVRKEILEEAIKLKIKILDLTCPELRRTREQMLKAEKEGYQVLFLGDRGHSEVESLLSFSPAFRLISAAELPAFSLSQRIALFSQSTQDSETLSALARLLVPEVLELRVFNTICFATRQRQNALRKILPEVEGVVVVGGKNSANTRRLTEIAISGEKKAWHVEDASELQPEWFQGVLKVGVASGASTPQETVDEVVERLKSF